MSIKLMRARSLRRLAAATLFALPLAALAATVTGYEDFGNVAGVQLWRTATDSGVTDFALAKFAAVAADGTVGVVGQANSKAVTIPLIIPRQALFSSMTRQV